MMKNKKPEIRFKGFSEEWEKRELSQIIDLKGGRDYKHLSNGDIPVYGTGGYMTSVSEALSYNEDAIGIGRKGTIDKPYKLKAPFWTVDTLFYALPLQNNNLDFIFDIFQKIDWKQKNEATGVPSLSKVAINCIKVFTTKSEEQTQIGYFFKNLDNLITLHQRKYEKLGILKKAMLEKMFPKNGANVPEIRFKGFEGAWEERKLSDTAEFNPKSVLPESFLYVDLESVVGTEMVAYREESKYSAPSRAQRLAHKGDLFYQTVRPYQKNNYLFDSSENNYVFSTGYAQMRPHGDGYFLLCLVQNDGFVKSILDRCTGTSYPAINSNDLAETQVFIPIIKEEQEKIGNFFKKLDNLLTIHRGELEKLKNIKKALLKKMFV